MTTFTVRMVLDRETKGALRFAEVDDHGKPADAWAKIGTQYIRKTAFERGAAPKEIKVTVEC